MAKFKERRSSPKAGRVADLAPEKPAGRLVLRDGIGFHTMEAVREFIQYDLDGGAQTEWNERFVMPLCMAVFAIDGLEALSSQAARDRVLTAVGEELGKLTRRADRLARAGNEYVVLLRRTLSKKAHDFYVPNARKAIAEAAAGTTACVGISSVTEHMIRGADDMIKKAYAALEVARKQGPGSIVVYDFRTMPY